MQLHFVKDLILSASVRCAWRAFTEQGLHVTLRVSRSCGACVVLAWSGGSSHKSDSAYGILKPKGCKPNLKNGHCVGEGWHHR